MLIIVWVSNSCLWHVWQSVTFYTTLFTTLLRWFLSLWCLAHSNNVTAIKLQFRNNARRPYEKPFNCKWFSKGFVFASIRSHALIIAIMRVRKLLGKLNFNNKQKTETGHKQNSFWIVFVAKVVLETCCD